MAGQLVRGCMCPRHGTGRCPDRAADAGGRSDGGRTGRCQEAEGGHAGGEGEDSTARGEPRDHVVPFGVVRHWYRINECRQGPVN